MSIRGLNCRQHSLCPFQTVFPMSTVGGRLLKLMDHRPDPQGISEVHIISGGQRCLNFFMSLALCTPFLKFFCSILQVENCHREQRTAMMNHCNGEPVQIRELHFFGGGGYSTVLFAMMSSQVEIQHFSSLTYSFPFCMSKNWSFPDLNINTLSQLVDHDSFHN